MQHKLILLFLSACIAFSSCSKKDKDDEQPDQLTLTKSKVQGKWQYTGSFTQTFRPSGEKISENEDQVSGTSYFEFSADGNVLRTDLRGVKNLGYTVTEMDQKIFLTFIDNGTEQYQVFEINDLDMKLRQEGNAGYEIDGEVPRIITTAFFKKQ